MLWWIVANAQAEDCEIPEYIANEAEELVVSYVLSEATVSLARAEVALGCSGPASPTVLARLLNAEGTIALLQENAAGANLAYAAGRRLDAEAWKGMYGDDAHAAWLGATVEGVGKIDTMGVSGATRAWVDGVEMQLPAEVAAGKHLVQVARAGAPPAFARWVVVRPGETATFRPVLPALEVGTVEAAPVVDFGGDVSAQLKAQSCDEEAARLADVKVAARRETDASKVKAEASSAWGTLLPQLSGCTRQKDRSACVAQAEAYISTWKGARVEVPAGVEVVDTACGQRSWAVPARMVPVRILEVSEAELWRLRLNGPANAKDGWSPTLGVLKSVPSGVFTMGSPTSESGRGVDETQHKVKVGQSFQMMATEVTQGMYRKVVGSNPSIAEDAGVSLLGDELPVQNVSWLEAVAFANQVSKAEGLSECYAISGQKVAWTKSCTGYRLPTEVEWERAARGGGASVFGATNDAAAVCSFANVADAATESFDWSVDRLACDDGVAGLAAAGTYKSNDYGLYDMTGNVWEWVWDWYGGYPTDSADAGGPASGPGRVGRGGGYNSGAANVRVADRSKAAPDNRDVALGFRLVRAAP